MAFSKDDFLDSLSIPKDLTIGVMINASDLKEHDQSFSTLKQLFPKKAKDSSVDLVRIASHYSELNKAIVASRYLKDQGYKVAINLMQISERTLDCGIFKLFALASFN